MIKAFIVGNLTEDPNTHTTQSGIDVTTVGIAGANGFGDKKKTDYFRLTFFGARGAAIQKWCHKGDKLTVIGRFNTSEWTDRNGAPRKTLEVEVEDYEMSGGKGASAEADRGESRAKAAPASEPVDLEDDSPDSLPF